MLPKINRLPRWEITNVIKNGKQVQNETFRIKVLKTKQKISRFSVIVPVKITKTKVKRNRIKRLIRESLRKIDNKLTNCDMVIFIKKDISDKNQKEAEVLLLKLYKKLNYMK